MNNFFFSFYKRMGNCINISYLTSEIPQNRYPVLLQGSIVITIGSAIAILETFLSIYLNLHHIPFKQAILIAIFVLSLTSILIAVTYFKKVYLLWHEWAFFGVYVIFFQIGFCMWVYRLGNLRILALINAITIIIILLSYTNIIQSLLISMLTLFSYYYVTRYSILTAGQPGSLLRETFFCICLIPGFVLISSAAYYFNKKRHALLKAKSELEKLNSNLSEINTKLQKEQVLSGIEMDLASEIQNSIFPRKIPSVSDWDIAFFTKPYGTISGDFYDFYCSNNSLKGISLFDVSGHGIAPALITILAKPVLYNYFTGCESSRLGRVLEHANSDLIEELEEVNLYITGIILRMNGREVEYSNAGHPDLLHYKVSNGRVRIITDSINSFKGHPIGISNTAKSYPSLKFTVSQGDYLIFYSDGLTESRNYSGEEFGIIRLSNAIEASKAESAGELLNHIIESLKNFTGNNKEGDDITVIVAGKK